MANWWEQYQLAPQSDVTSTGFATAPMPAPQQAQAPALAPVPPPGAPQGAPAAPRFLTPQPQTMGGLFAGLPREALMIAGLSGPESGIKFLAPFMTQSPIEVMTPNGPMFMSPWQARGMPSPGTMLGFRKDDRDERQFGLEKDKFRLDSANRPVMIDANGRLVVNSAALSAAQQQSDLTQPPIPVQVPGQGPGAQVLVPRSMAAGQAPPKELTTQDRDAIREADQNQQAAIASKAALDRALTLNKTAFQGPTTGVDVFLGRVNAGLGGTSPRTTATTELESIMKETALNQLKMIFGGNPTEGERKILLEMQGSGGLSRDERDALLKRAKAAVENRERIMRETAGQLRGGSYYQQGGGPTVPAAPSGTVTVPMPQAGGALRFNPQTGRIE